MKSAIIKAIVIILFFSLLVEGKKNENVITEFDFIVVGSGASGSIVASRLANETNNTVLLLEGGKSGTGQRDIGGEDYVASYFKADPETGEQELDVPLTRYDVPSMADTIRFASDVLDNIWNISAVGPFLTQAKVVGGNQATNGLIWYSPFKADLDALGIPEYSGDAIHEIIKRIENATETGYGNTPGRGNAGPINVISAAFRPREQQQFLDLLVAQGYTQGGDFNTGKVNASTFYVGQSNIKRGIRQSNSIGYLAKVVHKENLEFRTSTTVTRVLFDALTGKIAVGVEYADKNGELKQVFARKEVILAAGDIQIPKILYNSGIGPLSILNAFNKPQRVVNELIGQKVRNHQRVSMQYNDSTLLNVNYYANPAASVQYARTGQGIMGARSLLFLYINSTNCSSHCPDITVSLGSSSGNSPTDVYSQRFSITVGLAHNLYANGTLNLTSSDPLARTVYRTNALSLDEDVTRLAKGVLQVRELMANWPGNEVELEPGPDYQTLEEVKEWVRSEGGTYGHYHGSVPMGNDTIYPLDTKMRVKGVTKLRVVGPAILNGPVFPGMQVLASALGELASDFIKQEHNL